MDEHSLYRETLLAHGKSPRNRTPLADATHGATVDNPVCGDRVRVELLVDGDRITQVCFGGRSCLVATASASLMTEAVRGRTIADFEALHRDVEATCHGDTPSDPHGLDALRALAGVRDYPARRQCALLPWDALRRALALPDRS